MGEGAAGRPRAWGPASCPFFGMGGAPGCHEANRICWCPFLSAALLPCMDPGSWSLGRQSSPEPAGSFRASLGAGSPLPARAPWGAPAPVGGVAFSTLVHRFLEQARDCELGLGPGRSGWLDGWAFQKRRAAGGRWGDRSVHPGEGGGGLGRLCNRHLLKWLPGGTERASSSVPAGRAGLLRNAACSPRLWGGPGPAPRRRRPGGWRPGPGGTVAAWRESPSERALISPGCGLPSLVGSCCGPASPVEGRPRGSLPRHLALRLCLPSEQERPGPGICGRRETRSPVDAGN